MPIVGTKTKNDITEALKLGVGTAIVGLGSSPSGVIGALGSVIGGYVGQKYICKGTYGTILMAFSVINAVDILMEGMTPKGVFG